MKLEMCVLEALAYSFEFYCFIREFLFRVAEKAVFKLLGRLSGLAAIWRPLTDFRTACFIGDVFRGTSWPTLRLALTNW